MRTSTLPVAVLGLGLLLAACGGPAEPPTEADPEAGTSRQEAVAPGDPVQIGESVVSVRHADVDARIDEGMPELDRPDGWVVVRAPITAAGWMTTEDLPERALQIDLVGSDGISYMSRFSHCLAAARVLGLVLDAEGHGEVCVLAPAAVVDGGAWRVMGTRTAAPAVTRYVAVDGPTTITEHDTSGAVDDGAGLGTPAPAGAQVTVGPYVVQASPARLDDEPVDVDGRLPERVVATDLVVTNVDDAHGVHAGDLEVVLVDDLARPVEFRGPGSCEVRVGAFPWLSTLARGQTTTGRHCAPGDRGIPEGGAWQVTFTQDPYATEPPVTRYIALA